MLIFESFRVFVSRSNYRVCVLPHLCAFPFVCFCVHLGPSLSLSLIYFSIFVETGGSVQPSLNTFSG